LRINHQKQAETAKKDAQEKLEAFQEEEKKRLTVEAAKRITEVDNDIKLATQQMTGGGSCASDETFKRLQRAVREIDSEAVRGKITALNPVIQSTNMNYPIFQLTK
jgi:hypothetical protein